MSLSLQMHDAITAFQLCKLIVNEPNKDRKWQYLYRSSKIYRCRERPFHVNKISKDLDQPSFIALDALGLHLVVHTEHFGYFSVMIPDIARCSYDYSMYSAKLMHHELCRQCYLRNQVAKLLTIGGGWACLRREQQALACTRKLHELAVALADQKLIQKCSIFLGWGLLWAGYLNEGIRIFRQKLKQAIELNDRMLQQQCHHALINATTNPLITRSQTTVA